MKPSCAPSFQALYETVILHRDRSQIKQLQAEVERLRSVLAREVGQPQVQPLLEGRPGSGWRGRAEIIDNLK